MNNKELNKLLLAMQKGDNAAFDTLFRECRKPVFAFILSYTRNYAKAEDIAQDTFVKIATSVGGYKSGNAISWIYQIAKNLAINSLYRSRREVSTDFKEDELQLGTYFLPDNTDITAAMLKVLTPIEQQLVVMHLIAGYKHREIAIFVNKPLGTVTSTYKSALKKLKTELSKED